MSEKKRRMTQCEGILKLMREYRCRDWWTLAEIVKALWNSCEIRASEAGVSARLRELRANGETVKCRPRFPGQRLQEYTIVLAAKVAPASQTGGIEELRETGDPAKSSEEQRRELLARKYLPSRADRYRDAALLDHLERMR